MTNKYHKPFQLLRRTIHLQQQDVRKRSERQTHELSLHGKAKTQKRSKIFVDVDSQ